MLKWIAKNKYKLMPFILIGLYLSVDVAMHKGLTRVLFPKKFHDYKIDNSYPKSKNVLINTNKEWKKAIDTKEQINTVDINASGIECDVYFDTTKKIFDVHHDPDKSIGLNFDTLLQLYTNRGLKASIWLDFKDLDEYNCKPAVTELVRLRDKYGLAGKILVESRRPELLAAFTDSGFFTSYYTPMFNPYRFNNDQVNYWVDSLTKAIQNSKVNAISGYYYQYDFLHHYFPNYPLITWADDDKWSFVNWLFKRKAARSKEVFIVLYP